MTEPQPSGRWGVDPRGDSAGHRPRPVVFVTHSYYEEDPRVRRQAETIAATGRPVDVVALRRPGDPASGEVGGVHVIRLDVQRHQGAGLGTYAAEYLSFFVRVAATLVRTHARRRYALVQVATLPDWLVFAAAALRLVRVPVLLDLHESMPDFFRSRFPRAANPLAYRGLLVAERLSILSATHAMTVNDALRARLIDLGIAPDHVTVVRNTPSLARFDVDAHPSRAFMADGMLRLVYAGALTPTYELDVVVRALAHLAREKPELPIHLDAYGRGDSRAGLEVLAADLGVADRITFHGRIPIDDVPAVVARADVGLAPTRRDGFTDASLSTKILEYAAMRRSVVASRLPLVEQTFPDGSIATYAAGDPVDLSARLLELVDDRLARDTAIAAAAGLVREMAWERDAPAYVALIERYLNDRRQHT